MVSLLGEAHEAPSRGRPASKQLTVQRRGRPPWFVPGGPSLVPPSTRPWSPGAPRFRSIDRDCSTVVIFLALASLIEGAARGW